VKYPEGKVLNVYGEKYKQGAPEQDNGLFCRQHGCKRSEEGYLYLYDNNSCQNAPPKLLLLQEPVMGEDSLKIKWEYKCTVDGVDTSGQVQYEFPVGGNIIELPDHSFFAVMSSLYNKVFIVGRDKKIVWSAIPERWNATDKKWDMVYQYRASIITDREKLEHLIWSSEAQKNN
jgi:hypothetical protein